YWLRSLAAGLLTGVFVWSAWTLQTSGGLVGLLLFKALSDGLLLSLLVVIAGITADTISREKREGTLGLLFLTPLRARDIVLGKVPKWISYWWLFVCIAALIYSAAALVWSVRFASRRLEATWQRESAESESWWVKFFSESAFWRIAFHWNTKKARDRNPIAWL